MLFRDSSTAGRALNKQVGILSSIPDPWRTKKVVFNFHSRGALEWHSNDIARKHLSFPSECGMAVNFQRMLNRKVDTFQRAKLPRVLVSPFLLTMQPKGKLVFLLYCLQLNFLGS